MTRSANMNLKDLMASDPNIKDISDDGIASFERASLKMLDQLCKSKGFGSFAGMRAEREAQYTKVKKVVVK